MVDNQFALELEDGVREWVLRLRAAGINTECSCGHEGYIQCQSIDPPTEIERIKAVLHDHGLWEYEITWTYTAFAKDYSGWRQSIEIRSKMFKADLVSHDG